MILRNMTFKERLDFVYSYFKSKYTEKNIQQEKDQGYNEEYYTVQDPLKFVFGFAIDAMGYNGFPVVLKDEDWEKIDGVTYYHGYEEYAHGANFLNDAKYHYGDGRLFDGTLTNGFYLTKNKYIAKLYTKPAGDRPSDSDRVLPVKLKLGRTAYLTSFSLKLLMMKKKEDYSGFGSDEINQNFTDLKIFLDSIKSDTSEQSKMFRRIIKSPTLLAVLMGYEYFTDYENAMTANGRNLKDSLIVQDRSLIMVRESDYNRFIEMKDNINEETILVQK